MPPLTPRSSRTAGRLFAFGFALLLLVSLLAGAAFAGRKIDHAKFPQLKGPFENGPQVTRACLSCHVQAGPDILATRHWLWRGEAAVVPGHDNVPRSIGKANLINNFCIGIRSNEAGCTRCHIGYGWTDNTFDFGDVSRIDCLVCHDTTEEYIKNPSPDEKIDWVRIAGSVGRTSIQTCGGCHFYGGGGKAVKHGDLDPTLMDAGRDLDLHMDKDGLSFTCSTCHRGEENPHKIEGTAANASARVSDTLSCAKCHGEAPHGRPFIARTHAERVAAAAFRSRKGKAASKESELLNWHTRKLACETCHIPRYAKRQATKTWWDWSKAGRLTPEGRPVQVTDADGDITYFGNKGAFRWEKNLVPEYRWYNGSQARYLLGDTFDPARVLVFNPLFGGPNDPKSKIRPFKIMRGKQIYDARYRYLIQPKLSGPKGSGAYWADYDWDNAARAGMAAVGLPYSGQYGFAETEMYWGLSHMSVEGEKSLGCGDCHSRKGRLANIAGVYIPGQSRSRLLDAFGWLGFAVALAAASGHAFLRWSSGRKRPSPGEAKPESGGKS